MKDLVSAIQQFSPSAITYENLWEFVRNIDFPNLPYQDHIPYECAPGDYGRNILTLDPFECVLIYWPPGIESAIHFHEGFFGYVVLLEGALDNVEYVRTEGQLQEVSAARYLPVGIMNEPDRVIHKLSNPDPHHGAVSLHFYYPALENLEDLVIYHIGTGSEGVLSAQAKAASWSDQPGHFKAVRTGVFEFLDIQAFHKQASHLIHPVIPKPSPELINQMNAAYYCEQAHLYDHFDTQHTSRKAYIDCINHLISQDLPQHAPIKELLAIACGTGRRAMNIRDAASMDYHITGVDPSEKMCELAKEKALTLIEGHWLSASLPEGKQYDAATWLYSFGHVSTPEMRAAALGKIFEHLKPGAPFYLDVFNLHNPHEWGPRALRAYERLQLQDAGYDRGDVFYRRSDGKEIAFLHYFEEQEIRNLLETAGFTVERLLTIGYVKDSGKIKSGSQDGFFFIQARKPG